MQHQGKSSSADSTKEAGCEHPLMEQNNNSVSQKKDNIKKIGEKRFGVKSQLGGKELTSEKVIFHASLGHELVNQEAMLVLQAVTNQFHKIWML